MEESTVFFKQFEANKEAVKAGMQIVYWLAESEVAHFIKFESLKQLYINLGASVLRICTMERMRSTRQTE